MALSPNYQWAEPDNSSLVKNGAQDIRALGDAIDTSVWNIGFGQAGKNAIINGNFSVWQRGTSFTPAASAYTADRWEVDAAGAFATSITCSQQAFTAGAAPVAGYEGQYFYRLVYTKAGSQTAQYLTQKIEDVRTFAGQPVTVSFWAKCDAARTITVNINQNFGSGGSSAVAALTGTASATTSWTRFSVTGTLPSISGKTIGTSSYLAYQFVMPNASSTTDIWGVQIEYGSKATPFDTATGTIQGELAACQRYYYRTTGGGSWSVLGTGQAFSTTNAGHYISFPVEMRIRPTALEQSGTASNYATRRSNSSTDATTSVPTYSNATKNGANIESVSVNLVAGNATVIQDNNTTAAYLGWSAEL